MRIGKATRKRACTRSRPSPSSCRICFRPRTSARRSRATSSVGISRPHSNTRPIRSRLAAASTSPSSTWCLRRSSCRCRVRRTISNTCCLAKAASCSWRIAFHARVTSIKSSPPRSRTPVFRRRAPEGHSRAIYRQGRYIGTAARERREGLRNRSCLGQERRRRGGTAGGVLHVGTGPQMI